MSSPSSSIASTAPRRTKYKDSCDSCAQAKVKCSRVRPSCQRCVRNGIVCHYSLARRGKAAAMLAAPAGRGTGSPEPSSAPISKHQQEYSMTADDFCSHADLAFMDGDFALSAEFTASPLFDTVSMSGIPRELHGVSHDLPPLSLSSLSSLDPDLLSTPPEPSNHHHLGQRSCSEMGEPSHVLDSAASVRLMLSTLESLHLSSPSPFPGIDTILKNNSAAVANVSALVKSPNALNTPHATLLALICCNSVIDAYQQISVIQQNLSDADSDRSRTGAVSQNHQYNHPLDAMTALDMPITFGAFPLDSDAKQKVILSLLLNELAKVGNVVERVVQGNKGGSPASGQSINGSCELVSTLRTVLKEKLRATVKAVKGEMVVSDQM